MGYWWKRQGTGKNRYQLKKLRVETFLVKVTIEESSSTRGSWQVLLYPGVLAGSAGQQFGSMVEKGGPLGELVQWADLSACLTILGHNLTLSTSQDHLHRYHVTSTPS